MWDNGDLVTHEVMGGLKNVYAIGAGKIEEKQSQPFSITMDMIA